jgi:hypothetical protein
MGKKSGPPAPDYAGAAQAQGQASKDVINSQTFANRPNQVTPFGTQTWAPYTVTDPTTGQPVTQWTSNTQLNPQQQQALDDQMNVQAGRSWIGQGLMPGVANSLSTPFDFGGLPARGQLYDPGHYATQAQDTIQQLQQPNLDQRRAAVETRLSNQGISPGSEAYRNSMRVEDDAETRANLSGILASQQYGNQLFGQGLQGAQFANQNRASALGEGLTERNMPLTDMNAVLNGQGVNNPIMPAFANGGAAQPTNFLGAAGLQGQHDLDVYNAQQGQLGSAMGGLFNLGSSYMMSNALGGGGSLFGLGGGAGAGALGAGMLWDGAGAAAGAGAGEMLAEAAPYLLALV